MRIRSFAKNIEVNELKRYNLKNCNVVIDGQNYFYDLYQDSELPYEFGCESDKYANYLRDHLSMFIKANVKCYIIFKGGHADEEKRFKKKEKYLCGNSYEVINKIIIHDNIVLPVFMKTVYKEVLDEMGIDYVMCEFESKKQCIALAQMLSCPIISFDIEFGFSGVPYIPYVPSLTYDIHTASIQCGMFKLDDFMKKYRITKEKIALFIVLSDANIFPELFFKPLFEKVRIQHLNNFKRNQALITWLSRNTVEQILRKTFETLSPAQEQKFEEEQIKMLDLIGRIETPGEPVKYLKNGKSLSFEEHDPCWFEKGVICNKIASSYVNLYFSNAFYGSWSIEDLEADDALFLSIDLIKYAFNLLTNYKRNNIAFWNNKWEVQNVNVSLTNSESVQKPPYEAIESPFENGWDRLESLKLFDYFIKQSLPDVNIDFTNIPKDGRLFMLTIIYFSRRKAVDTTLEVYSILLSYVMLGVVLPKITNNNCTKSDKDLVALCDCLKAFSITEPFFKLNRCELEEIFDRKIIHPFVEFQHCLKQMNNLNTLCGQRCFEPTVYSKTYNGTFVYRMFYSLKNKSGKRALQAIKKMLTPAPSVLDFFMSLVAVYEQTKKS